METEALLCDCMCLSATIVSDLNLSPLLNMLITMRLVFLSLHCLIANNISSLNYYYYFF